MQKEADRPQVIEQYRVWLWEQIKQGAILLEDLADLHGKDIFCWCSPKKCHGDVLAEAAAWAHKKLGRPPIAA